MTAADTQTPSPPGPTAEVVVDLLVADVDTGFAELVRAYDGVVYSVALRVCGQPHSAEDLAAEAFLRAYRALRGYPVERIRTLRPRAWLITILLNAWRNAVRDSSRRPDETPLAELDLAAHAPGVEEQAEQRERGRELAALVAQLPAAQRVAVVLRHVVGMSVAEIGEAMNCPPGTVKSHVSRGLARLRAACQAPQQSGTKANGVPIPGRPR